MDDMLRDIREMVIASVNAQKLVNIFYGTVISLSPLEIRIDPKLTIKEKNIKLTRAVLDYEVEMTVDHLTENRSGGGGYAEFASHDHEYKGRKTFLIHNGLVVGDKVTMIRAQGGQQYVVIDKEVV